MKVYRSTKNFPSSNIKIIFKIPKNETSNDIVTKLKKLKDIDYLKFKSLKQLENLLNLPVDYLSKNWGNVQQINYFREQYRINDGKKYYNVIEPDYIRTTVLRSIKELLADLERCRVFRDEMQLTFNHNTRLLNKIEYSYEIIERHLSKKNYNYVKSLIFKYFSQTNYVLYIMCLLYPDSNVDKFLNSNEDLCKLKNSSNLYLILMLDDVIEFIKFIKIKNEFEMIKILNLTMMYAKDKISKFIRIFDHFLNTEFKDDYNAVACFIIKANNISMYKEMWLWYFTKFKITLSPNCCTLRSPDMPIFSRPSSTSTVSYRVLMDRRSTWAELPYELLMHVYYYNRRKIKFNIDVLSEEAVTLMIWLSSKLTGRIITFRPRDMTVKLKNHIMQLQERRPLIE